MNFEFKNLELKTASTTSEIELHKSERAITHFITTPDVDWGGDIVKPKGMDATMFEKHRTVFYNHNYDQPIGSNMWLKSKEEGVLAKTRFGKTLFADDIYSLHEDGIINTWSIGWQPKMENGKPKKDAMEYDDKTNRLTISEWDLVEYSVAPLAMNPNALDQIKSMAKSLEIKSIVKNYESNDLLKQIVDEQTKEINEILKAKAYLEEQIINQNSRIDILEKDLADMLNTLMNKTPVETLGKDYVAQYYKKLLEKSAG